MTFWKILKYFESPSNFFKNNLQKFLNKIIILKFRHIGRSTFDHSKFCTPSLSRVITVPALHQLAVQKFVKQEQEQEEEEEEEEGEEERNRQ